MDDHARQLAASTRAFEAARELRELQQRVWEQSAVLTTATQAASEAGVPRSALARSTGLSRSGVSQRLRDRAVLVEPLPFTGELVTPPYPAATPPGIPVEPRKRLPGEPAVLRDVPAETLARERELLRRVKVCLDEGMSVRRAAATVGASKSLVGRYYRVLRSETAGELA